MRHRLFDLLVPRDERDEGLRTEMERLSVTGLRTASGVGIGVPLFIAILGLFGVPGIPDLLSFERLLLTTSIGGFVPLAISFIPAARRYLRLLGVVAGFLIAVEGILGLMRIMPDPVRAAQISVAKTSAVMLVAIAVFPLKPMQALAMGLGITAALVAALGRAGYPAEQTGQAAIPTVGTFIIAIVCTVLTTILYRQRASAYWARRTAEESFEELRKAQARLLVSENALSLGRFAAALSHEMNTPLGALGSSIDTLSSLAEKARSQSSGGLDEAAIGVARTTRQSLGRLRETLDRMRHLVNLDRAEVQVVNLNELWVDLVALLGGELGGKADVKLDLKPLPPVKCRPQQLSAVFSNLLRNAAAAIETRGTIQISSDRRGAGRRAGSAR